MSLVFLAPFAVFAAAIFGPRVLYHRDILHFYFPAKKFFAESWARGEIPYWWPQVAGGMPFAADPQHGAFYPLNALYLVLPYPTAYALLVALHLGLGAAGVYRLAREMEVDAGGSLVAGLCYGLCGPCMSLQLYAPILPGAAFLPWFLLTLSRGARFAWAGGLLLAAIVYGGDPYGVVWAVGWGAAWVLVRGLGRPGLFALAGAAALGALVAAPQIALSAELLRESTRAGGLGMEEAGSWALAFHQIPELFLPLEHDHASGRGDFLPRVGFSLAAAALGARALARGEVRARILLSVSALFVVLALGPAAGLYRLLHALPLLDTLRYPAKLLVPAALGIALAAGQGARGLKPLLARAAPALLAAELLFHAFSMQERADRSIYEPPAWLQELPRGRVFRDASLAGPGGTLEEQRRWETQTLKRLLPSAWGLEDAVAYHPTLRRYNDLRTSVKDPRELLRILRVRVLVAPAGQAARVGARVVRELPGAELSLLDEVLPRAHLEGGSAEVVLDTPRELRVSTRAPAPGTLVLADTFYPGWMAYLDGGAALRIAPAERGVHRAVEAPAGEHIVTFRYEPWSPRPAR